MTAGAFDTTASSTVSNQQIVLLDGLAGDSLSIPFGDMALRADFVRQGPDLMIEGRDGEQILLQDYFATETPADLVLGDGAGVLKGALVTALAGSAAPGQYAQLDDAALSSGAVGQVEALTGEAFAVRVDGTRVPLEVGSSVYMGDVLETADDGAIAVAFLDGTTFSLAEDARMVVDNLVYDPSSDGNSAAFSLVQGLFVLVSGDIVKTGEMNIETPVSTVGIRGTSAAFQVAAEGLENLITLLQDPDGNVGVVEVATLLGAVILSEIGASTTVVSADQAPSPVEILEGADIEALYRAALAAMQVLSDANLGVEGAPDSSTTGDAAGDTADGTGNSGEGETVDPATAADPDVAVAAFAASVVGLFDALAETIEAQEIQIASTSHQTSTGAGVGENGAEGPGSDPVTVSDDDDDNTTVPDTPDTPATGGGGNGGTDVAVGGGGESFLQGTVLELGVAANGALGTTGAPPASFAAVSELGRADLSFYGDNRPLSDDEATTGDAFLPGTSVENFTLAFTDGVGAFVGSNQNAGNGTGIPMGLDGTSSSGGVATVTSSGGLDGRIALSQEISLGQNDTFFTTTVTITNTGDQTITGLRYMRSGDPDQDQEVGGSFSTSNDVLLNPDGGSGIAAVDAQGLASDQSILLLADQVALNTSNGLDQDSIQVRASAFGFQNLDPFANAGFDNPADPNGATGDIAINLVYDLPGLAPGESITISWITSINTASDGNDILVVRGDEVGADGGNGDDVIFASRGDTTETLNGGNGVDNLFASSAEGSGDVLSGGNGPDVLNSGGGADTMTGGNGPDVFFYNSVEDGFAVGTNTAFAGVGGAETDVLTDFVSGLDTLQLLGSAFGDLAPGNLVEGQNFSVIADSFDGTNAGTNASHAAGEGTFVYSIADGTLHYDGNGADAGYTAVAQMDQPTASDIEVVAAA